MPGGEKAVLLLGRCLGKKRLKKKEGSQCLQAEVGELLWGKMGMGSQKQEPVCHTATAGADGQP